LICCKSFVLTVFIVLLFAVLNAATQSTAAEWKLQEGDSFRYEIVTLRLNGTRHADEIENDYFTLYDVAEGDIFTLRVGEIASSVEECEWEYGIWLRGQEVSSTSYHGNLPCADYNILDMIFPVGNRSSYESLVVRFNSGELGDHRTANFFNETFEIIEENPSYTEIMRYNIAQGYHTYYCKAAGMDIFEYKELKATASPGDTDRNLTAITVIGLTIWSIVVLLCLAAGGWVIRDKYRSKQ
jgi:hypothetical protein